ncbi:MAG TPA: hypothetical protein VK463_11075 [Desulfomonilaceae bacterium]|nr:hypothetical protein [Desulfomonilaceae bacterium]
MAKILIWSFAVLSAIFIEVNSCEAVRLMGRKTPFQSPGQSACPQRIRQVNTAAAADVAKFRKLHPSWAWSAFLLKTKSAYKDCPSYVRKAYLKTAREKFHPSPPPRFSRP